MPRGPIIFMEKKVLDFLKKRRFVFTFRAKKRAEGKTWMTNKRFGKKLGTVEVKLLTEIEPTREKLSPYLRGSGFDSLDEWIEAIKRLNNGLPEKGYLYVVRLIGG